MSAEQIGKYPLREALARVAPLAGVALEDAHDYVLIVITKDGSGAVSASERLPPALAAQVLRASADSLEAGQ